jgi:hypothetical protein
MVKPHDMLLSLRLPGLCDEHGKSGLEATTAWLSSVLPTCFHENRDSTTIVRQSYLPNRFGFFMKHLMLIIAAVLAAMSAPRAAPQDDQLMEGDLIFQNSRSAQSAAILGATGSPYTHMGIIVRKGGDLVVLEAGATVRETNLRSWTASGVGGHHAVYRMERLEPGKRAAMIESARRYLGWPYDIFFDFEGEAIYCSELPYLAFGAVGIPIGKVQTVSELKLGDRAAQALIRERWRKHPRCIGMGFDDCMSAVMRQTLITPASIAADPQFTRVLSTFRQDATR